LFLCLTARVKKAINNVDEAFKNVGRQKRDVINTILTDQLKKKASELVKKLETKQGDYKRGTLLKLREKKREAKGRQLVKKTVKSIRENLINMAPKKP